MRAASVLASAKIRSRSLNVETVKRAFTQLVPNLAMKNFLIWNLASDCTNCKVKCGLCSGAVLKRVKSGIFGQTAKFGQRPCLFNILIIGIQIN